LEQLGWKIKWDSTGRVQSATPVDGMEQVEPMPSWGTLIDYWKEHFPQMRIQSPRKDICGQCCTFANSFRFEKKKKLKTLRAVTVMTAVMTMEKTGVEERRT